VVQRNPRDRRQDQQRQASTRRPRNRHGRREQPRQIEADINLSNARDCGEYPRSPTRIAANADAQNSRAAQSADRQPSRLHLLSPYSEERAGERRFWRRRYQKTCSSPRPSRLCAVGGAMPARSVAAPRSSIRSISLIRVGPFASIIRTTLSPHAPAAGSEGRPLAPRTENMRPMHQSIPVRCPELCSIQTQTSGPAERLLCRKYTRHQRGLASGSCSLAFPSSTPDPPAHEARGNQCRAGVARKDTSDAARRDRGRLSRRVVRARSPRRRCGARAPPGQRGRCRRRQIRGRSGRQARRRRGAGRHVAPVRSPRGGRFERQLVAAGPVCGMGRVVVSGSSCNVKRSPFK